MSGAYQDYRKAVNDERLARLQLHARRFSFEKGAIAKSALEAGRRRRARMRRPIWMRPRNSCGFWAWIKIIRRGLSTSRAPISGVITDQQVTNAAGRARVGLAESVHYL